MLIISSFSYFQLDNCPKHGTSGDPIKVMANYVPLQRPSYSFFYQHSLQFSPEVDDVRLMRFLAYQSKEQLKANKMVCDGRILYTWDSLGNEEGAKMTKVVAKSGVEYEVEVTFTHKLSFLDRQGMPVRKMFSFNRWGGKFTAWEKSIEHFAFNNSKKWKCIFEIQ